MTSTVRFALALAFGVGFLSLSQEILFVRLVGFVYQTTPFAFSFVLIAFLLGIAAGAHAGKLVCARGGDLRRAAGVVLLVAAAVDFAIPWVAPALFWHVADKLAIGGLIFVTAAIKSVLFPVAHELGATPAGARVGASVSRVYASNVLGATLGPIVTGFFVLDAMGVAQAFMLVATGTLALALVAWAGRFARTAVAAATVLAAIAAFAWTAPPDTIRAILSDRLMRGETLGTVLENRSGIVHTVEDGRAGTVVFGGNVYDGRINTDLRANTNSINRAYVLATLHPNPERVLVIGMSSGAWTWVVSKFPGVKRIDVVEINPAYLELVRGDPTVAPILTDPRVTIHVDDGRRWLARNPGERYDLVVMNTSFHWRAYATNLLSRQFLSLVRAHMHEGAVMTFNTTGSDDAVRTAQEVFPFVRRYSNFVYASDHDFVAGSRAMIGRVYAMRAGAGALLEPDVPADAAAVDSMMAIRFVTPEAIQARTSRPLEVITDENMITEFRYGRKARILPPLD